MWILNTDTNKWEPHLDTLPANSPTQPLQDIKLYSRNLSGAVYLSTNNTDDIYDAIKYKDNLSWYVGTSSSDYLTYSSIPVNGQQITDQYSEYLDEYGFTLKNYFTPEKAIANQNTIIVDLATTTQISLNSTTISSIDGILLINGQTILVKDQISTADLNFAVDPNAYFTCNYYIQSNNITDIVYYYYDNTNGIYTYTNNVLVKATFSSPHLNVRVKLGTTNQDKQFAPSRLLNGYYPQTSDPTEFQSSHNYLVRHQLDYHDLYEDNYFDILKHATQSIAINNFTYSIPQRAIYVGDFGTILVQQGASFSQYIKNNFKNNLKCITQTDQYYFCAGDNGCLLKISKIDLSIIKIDLNETNVLNSVSFFNPNKGIIVGDYNTIYYTEDSGYNWYKMNLNISENSSYNRVIYNTYTSAYIVGDNGLFLQLNFHNNAWNYTKIGISKFLSLTDEYELIEDINDMYLTNFSGLTTSSSWLVNSSTQSKDCLLLSTNNNNVILYDINRTISSFDFLYLSFSYSFGDITSITRQYNSNNIIFSGNEVVSFDINDFGTVSATCSYLISNTYSVLYTAYNNRIYDYNGKDLYNVGNVGLAADYNYFTSSYNLIETNNIEPKMLVMDYDLADKLNFFDYEYNYRLPNSVTISLYNGVTYSFMSQLVYYPMKNTWLDYLVDSYKTFAVNATIPTSAPILLSTKFDHASASFLTFSNTTISLTFSDMSILYPVVGSPTTSRYLNFIPATPSNAYNVYMYKYISIFKLPYNFCNVGDMLEISNNNINANLLINYQYAGYYYAFNDFNQNMLHYIKNDSVLTITNLNKYVSYNDLINNFSKHPISDGYELTYDGYNFHTNGLFNNKTAYKSLETYIFFIPPTNISSVTSSSLDVVTYAGSVRGYRNGSTDIALFTRPENIYINNNIMFIAEGGTNSTYSPSDTTSYRNSIRKIDLFTNNVTTYAGGTLYGTHSGDGGYAISAGLHNPTGIASDSLGNIYFTEIDASYIRKVDASTGIISTILGNGTPISSGDGGIASSATTERPFGITIDTHNNIYFSETGPGITGSNRIRKIDHSTNIVNTICGTAMPGYSGDGSLAIDAILNNPNFIYSDTNNNIYICDNGNRIVRVISSSTSVITAFAGTISLSPSYSTEGIAATSFDLFSPSGITMDLLGNFYIGDQITGTNSVIRKIFTDGTMRTIAGATSGAGYNSDGYPPLQTLITVAGLSVDSQLNIYFGDFTNNKIRKISYNDYEYMTYDDKFDRFGYTPNYNILNYLSNINYNFTASKVFNAMPKYVNLPGNDGGSFTNSNIYYDSNLGTTFPLNKIIMGADYIFEWNSLWINTFVDLTINGSYTKTLLITNKYYDTIYLGYAIEFNDKILDAYNIAVNTITILSRNTLGQISNDLNIFNNLNKPLINNSDYFDYYSNPIKTKINTDSYTKILLSDGDIKNYLTSIIYTDYNNELVMNMVNINNTVSVSISNSYFTNSFVGLNTTIDLYNTTNELAYISFNGGTGSSQILNPNYIGVHNISYNGTNSLLTDILYEASPLVADTGYVIINKFDPFLNYDPIDLFDVGVDNMYKIPIILTDDNIFENSIVNFTTNANTFRLVDGLDINAINTNYHWILEAEVSGAIIGQDLNGLVWYAGNFSGRWFGGTWYSGNFMGDWYTGNFYSRLVNTTSNVIKVGNVNDNISSVFTNGRFFAGNIYGSIWQNGRFYSGSMNNSIWYNGIFNGGTFNGGQFIGGVWVNGNFNKAIFSCDNKPAFWLNGNFYNSNFLNGIWYNGNLQNSEFGASASNSKNASFRGGKFNGGNIYSYKNVDSNGVPVVSMKHKYTNIQTGIINASIYGGYINAIDYKNSEFFGGIVADIEIIGVGPLGNTITLNGIFRFNINDYINIINNNRATKYFNLGNDDNPGKYRIALVEFDYTNNWTILTLDYNFSSLSFTSPYNTITSSNVDTGLRVVSKFTHDRIHTGIICNGIYDGCWMVSNIFYNGVIINNL